MSQDHAALVAAADHLFPGRVVRELTYEDFRRDLFALFKEEWGALPAPERLQNGWSFTGEMQARTKHPFWKSVFEEIDEALQRIYAADSGT